MPSKPLIIAHRGASAHAPENTLAAFQMAIDAGAEGIEFDVRLAKDGVPVVIHDPNLKRTGLDDRRIGDLTSRELSMIDVGSWFNLRYPKKAEVSFREQTVVTLAELMNAYDSFKGLFYIELKCGKKDYAALVSAVCDVIRDSPLLPQIIVKSFNLAALPVVHSLLANVQTAALFEPKVIDLVRRRSQLLTIARKYGADQLSLHYSLASPRLVSLAAAAGMPVTIWTADDPKWIERSRKRGIGAVITNDPQRLLLVRSAS